MKQMTRRMFLKCAGTAAFAVAAAGALTACGPSDSLAPTPVVSEKSSLVKPSKNDTGLDISSVDGHGVDSVSVNGVKTLYAAFPFTVKNTSGDSITLTIDSFTIKMDDGAEQKLSSIGEPAEWGSNSFTTKELKAGESASIVAKIQVSQATYDSLISQDHKVELIVHNHGADAAFLFHTLN